VLEEPTSLQRGGLSRPAPGVRREQAGLGTGANAHIRPPQVGGHSVHARRGRDREQGNAASPAASANCVPGCVGAAWALCRAASGPARRPGNLGAPVVRLEVSNRGNALLRGSAATSSAFASSSVRWLRVRVRQSRRAEATAPILTDARSRSRSDWVGYRLVQCGARGSRLVLALSEPWNGCRHS